MAVDTLFAQTDPGNETVRKRADIAAARIEALLEMTAYACGRLACDEQFVVDGAVYVMAHRASVSHGVVNEYPRTLLILVAVEALLVGA